MTRTSLDVPASVSPGVRHSLAYGSRQIQQISTTLSNGEEPAPAALHRGGHTEVDARLQAEYKKGSVAAD